jgi:RNA polymerase sigma-70 factor (ECF subfamily)
LQRFHVGQDEFRDRILQAGGSGSLQNLVLDDLVLAYACSRGDRSALDAFEHTCSGEYLSAASKLGLDATRRSEMRQVLWQRLFVGDGSPRILEYRGVGSLRSWFRVVASRFLLNELRRGKRDRLVLESDFGELCAATEQDPEFLLLERIHHRQFRAALQATLRELRPEQRTSLRCFYILGMTIDQMAEVFGVHRATAARRVAQSRTDLLRLTKERLRQDLGADTEELNSVIRHAQGQSSFSVARLLNESVPADNPSRIG